LTLPVSIDSGLLCAQIYPAIPALRKQKQKDHKFKANLGYTGRLCQKRRRRRKLKNGTLISRLFDLSLD
jgi:hypothetical protein